MSDYMTMRCAKMVTCRHDGIMKTVFFEAVFEPDNTIRPGALHYCIDKPYCRECELCRHDLIVDVFLKK